jgi:hypothetical protein
MIKVDPAFIAGVVHLRPRCSLSDIATILGCDRKRVLTAVARLSASGLPVVREAGAPRYRVLSAALQAEVTTLHNNGRGLDFYALCRVVRDVHPLAVWIFLRNEVNPRAWWVRACAHCAEPFATPRSAVRLCSASCSPAQHEKVSA